MPKRLLRLFRRPSLSLDGLDQVVLGLGNPGRRYAATRHNVGAMALAALAARAGLSWLPGRGDFLGARLGYPGGEALLALPGTWMNESGRAGLQLAEATGLPPACFLVLVDDLDLPLGRLRFRPGGGDGGHRGLGSLSYHWGEDRFPRLRIGVGRPGPEGAAEYVLQPFPEEDLDRVRRINEAAADAVSAYLESGLERAANRFNTLTIE